MTMPGERYGGRPNQNRRRISLHLSEEDIAFAEMLAAERGDTRSGALRIMVEYAKRVMPRSWRPDDAD